jgi:hypothetical protein
VLRCRLSKGAFGSGKLQGVGISEWGGNGGGGVEVGRSVYEQPGTRVDRILSQQGGFQVSKRDQKGESKKARGSRHNCIVHICVHNDCL